MDKAQQQGSARKNGSSLEHSKFAIQFRDVIARLVRKEIRALNPPPTYGIVANLDTRAEFICGVRFPPNNLVVQVRMGAYQPYQVGQAVRVQSSGGELFLEDVIGQGYFVGSGGGGTGGGGLPGAKGDKGEDGRDGIDGRDGVNGFDVAILSTGEAVNPEIYHAPALVYRYPP